jgi:hypothetical protein
MELRFEEEASVVVGILMFSAIFKIRNIHENWISNTRQHKNKTKAKPKKTCNFDQLPISRLSLRRKKNPCGSGSRPTLFFCRPSYFFKAIDSATLFSLGGCRLLPKWRLLPH